MLTSTLLCRRVLPVVALSTLALSAVGCGIEKTDDGTETAAPETSSSASPSTEGSIGSSTPATECSYQGGGSAAKKVDLPPTTPSVTGEVAVEVATSVGAMNLTLDAASAPCTVNSFVSLAEQGYFDDTTCHRLVTEGIFVLQCGDPSASGMGGPGYSYADELDGSETYEAGTLAMANAGEDTNGSQFFIVYADTPLPPAYTVFGSVDADTVKLVEKVAAKGNAADGVAPKQAVDLKKVTVG
ncbi:peptidylprolyl isomerase [Nocardioides yefusunii]|uniref:Peptidyl-prolyl cis-trans isomerase n=1 Tax=Nocardioides yefusunii TaxID=2500546 RepID=A0ABW1QVT4_9ACTN|nr:peptidylprolyl isomerase [Nocardioides yefusunii]